MRILQFLENQTFVLRGVVIYQKDITVFASSTKRRGSNLYQNDSPCSAFHH